jgi:surface antigen
MARTRISTTVDSVLLGDARSTGVGSNDGELIDAALAALLRQYRRAQLDEAYQTAYAARPITEPDEWGDLASFRDAAGAT